MKKITWQLVILVGCSLSMSAQAGTIYLCKAYSGGSFWASKHCNQHSAKRRVTASFSFGANGGSFAQRAAENGH